MKIIQFLLCLINLFIFLISHDEATHYCERPQAKYFVAVSLSADLFNAFKDILN